MADIGSRNKEVLRLHLIVLRCQAGDEAAFRELYDRFGKRTLLYLQNLLESREAEDVQQEVWLSVYNKISGLSNPKGFRTWLYQMTRNRTIDLLRKAERQSELFTPLTNEVIEIAFEALAARVARVANPNLPVPYSPPLEAVVLPSVEEIVANLRLVGNLVGRPEGAAVEAARLVGILPRGGAGRESGCCLGPACPCIRIRCRDGRSPRSARAA